MNMFRLSAVAAIIFTVGLLQAETSKIDISVEQVHDAFAAQTRPHPRLFLSNAELSTLRDGIKSSPMAMSFYEGLQKQAKGQLNTKPIQRVLQGRRLLSVSRKCLQRVFLWSMLYRLDGDRRYLERAEQEMLAAAAFEDWNPSHFLDVAEMTAALAIGYDWLYNDLSETTRDTIRKAILEKGLRPSIDGPQGYFHGHNNWTQVCNGGITLGALAIMEDEPELAEKIVHRAVAANGVQVTMDEYEPDGAYPEGPGYWDYGTSYNVILLAALKSVLGTDFGLSKKHGFVESAEYYLHVCGPTGLTFNYPDAGPGKTFSPAAFWFAQNYKKSWLAWNEYAYWQRVKGNQPNSIYGNRMAPLTLLWATEAPVIPQKTSWMGRGSNPVALFRISWTDPDAVFLGFKGGSAGVSHGHMDVGSFVLDADGQRWAVDLGPENYHKIESMGMKLWNMAPNSDRWKIFRYNNFSHNTLVVNGKHQIIDATAPIIRYSDDPAFRHAAIDMSDVYAGQLAKSIRGTALFPGGQVLIQDDLKAPDAAATVRWAMATPATVVIESKHTAMLTLKDKTMRFEVLAPDNVELITYSANPETEYDQPNPGVAMLGFEIELQPEQTKRLAVLMSPQSSKKNNDLKLKPVLEWSKPLH